MSVASTGSACASGAVTNEPECVATAIKAWLSVSHIGPVYIEPGKPWHNGAAEPLHREVPRRMLTYGVVPQPQGGADRHRKLSTTVQRERPHRSLNYRTPTEVGAGLERPPAAKDWAAICDPFQSAGLTLPVVQ
jgi:hypothetical protein